MKKYLSLIIFFIYVISSVNNISCSSEKENQVKKEEKKQETVYKEEKIKEKKEEISQITVPPKEKVEEEKVQLSEKEKNLYEKYLVYPWELLKDKNFKNLYLKALGGLKNIPWIRGISAVGGKNKIVEIKGKKYIYITFCKPHFCDTEMVYLLYSPEENRLFGVYLIESDYDFSKVLIGNPSEKDLEILAEAIKKDINSIVKGETILTASTLTPEDLGIKKLKPCPVLKKVNFIAGNNENVKNITEKIFHQFIKEEDINLDELNKLGFSLGVENLFIAPVDLNGDKRKDVVFTVNSSYFCGTGGCYIGIYVNKKNKYKPIDVSVLLQNTEYFYISKNKTNGYRDLIINDELILKYNGKKYVVGGKCYVK